MFDSDEWRLFLLLVVVGFLGLLSVRPLRRHFIELTTDRAAQKINKFDHSFIQTLSGSVEFLKLIVAVWGGLLLSDHLGLVGVPIISGILNGSEIPDFWEGVIMPILVGLTSGAIVSALMIFTVQADDGQDFFSIPFWKRMLAGLLQGGIFEELWYRLFLLSFFAWLMSYIFGLQDHAISNEIFWMANIAAALMFGADHLPSLDELGAVAKKDIALTMIFNGSLGLVYGYLFWHWGIAAAMLAHMSTHIVIQPCVPWLLKIKLRSDQQ